MVFIYFSFHLREMHFIPYLYVVCEVLGGDVSIATFIISFLPFLVVLISKALPCYIQEQPWTICLNQHEPYHHLSKLAILSYHLMRMDLSTVKTKQSQSEFPVYYLQCAGVFKLHTFVTCIWMLKRT